MWVLDLHVGISFSQASWSTPSNPTNTASHMVFRDKRSFLFAAAKAASAEKHVATVTVEAAAVTVEAAAVTVEAAAVTVEAAAAASKAAFLAAVEADTVTFEAGRGLAAFNNVFSCLNFAALLSLLFGAPRLERL